MKIALRLLSVLVIVGVITGIVLVISGKVAFAGVVWSITLIVSCIARRAEICRAKKEKQK